PNLKSEGNCSTSTDVGEPAMQIPILDLFGRIETAEKLGAVARKRYSIYFTSFLRTLSSFEGTNIFAKAKDLSLIK
ncbi:hypothetical protein M3181_26050, partial [Mesobacillus maritimus]|uniref:hypothetical protein n=1 Tax=Mesobacillus maritimus TaxID=1643336 RepID=UPI00203BCCBC